MLSAKTILNRRAIGRDGSIVLEFSKTILNGETVVSAEPNLMTVAAKNLDGTPIDWVYIRAQLDSHMGELGFDPVSDADWQLVLDFAATHADAAP